VCTYDFGPCHPANIRWDDGVKSAEAFQARPAAVFFRSRGDSGWLKIAPQNGWFDANTAQICGSVGTRRSWTPHLFDLTLILGDSILHTGS
jgi:hypothetical protein